MNLEKLLQLKFPELEHTATPRDAMLYALGIGVGDRPEEADDLQFVYEKGLKIFPSQVNVICHPGGWIMNPELEVNWVKLLHGEQAFEILKLLEPGKTYVGRYKITGVLDKGPGKGSLLFMRKELREKGDDTLVSTVDSTYFLRGDGGSGGTLDVAPAPHALPERTPDTSVTISILPRAALIYRLSGDYNPIHADPALARKAGFERPILHGLCSLGVATRAILQECCGNQPERLRSLQLRFSSPVYPGETLLTDIWRDGQTVSFRARVAERDVLVLNNGRAVIN
ncbi:MULTISPECIES: MaoC family dehydratase [Polaromonas]|uniref:MaoC/PaaZ C-terminal domain-containing protein n=1 Tax=Polaromonas aquatica TaxID=332657 RepID=A0ABW1U2U5_9BURK